MTAVRRREAVSSIAATGVASALGLGLTLLVSRSLPEAQAGVVFVWLAAVMVATRAGPFGADGTIVRFVALSGPRAERVDTLTRQSLALSLLIAPLVVVVALATSGLEALDIVTASAAAVAGAWLTVSLGVSRGYGRIMPTLLFDRIVRPAALVVGAGIAAVLGGGESSYMTLMAGGVGATAIVALLAEHPTRGQPRELPPTSPREFWRVTWPRGVGGFAAALAERLDIVILAVLSGPAAVAPYAVATRLLGLARLPEHAISQALQPVFATGLRQSPTASGFPQLISRTSRQAMAFCMPLYAALFVWPDPLLRIFGPGYPQAATALRILVIGACLGSAVGPSERALIMAGETRDALASSLLGLAATATLLYALVPDHGIIGAGAAVSVATASRALSSLWFVRLRFHRLPDYRSAAVVVLVGCALAAALLLLEQADIGPRIRDVEILAAAGWLAGSLLLANSGLRDVPAAGANLDSSDHGSATERP